MKTSYRYKNTIEHYFKLYYIALITVLADSDRGDWGISWQHL